LFYDAAGIPHAGIGISSDTLYEWREDGGELVRSVFDAGNGPVLVDPASSFTLNGCRNAITTDLRVKQLDGDIAVYTDPLREVFRCRN
ncbi:MAG: hypothetical protein JXA18_03000, partial [Chitinispirillaceae bacterium]|nr:hypothetical protein [Chitinispirillaceae bacterium]